MRRQIFTVSAVLLASSLLFTSCIGSFALTNKVLAWNQQIDNKFVNELVFFGFHILPVYEISALADLLVINSVEFWSGTNPVVADGSKVVKGENGTYLVKWTKKGYTITDKESGEVTCLDYTPETETWSVETPQGNLPFLTFIDGTHVKLPTAQGDEQIVELSQAGVLAYKEATAGNSFMALR